MILGLRKPDWVIVGVCIICIVICVHFLFAPEKIVRSGDGNLFGSIETSIRDVRLRPFDQNIWYQGVEVRSDLFENDRVFTGGQSFADIRAVSGDVLRLQPDSLVVLTRTGEDFRFELQQGAIEIFDKDSKSIQKIESPASFSMSKVTRRSRIEQKPKVIVKKEAPAPIESEGIPEPVIVQATPESTPTPVAVRPTLPPVLITQIVPLVASRQDLESGKTHKLQIRLSRRAYNQRIEVSRDPGFRKIIASAKAQEKVEFKGLPSGQYFVRLKNLRSPASVGKTSVQAVEIKDYDLLKPLRSTFPISGQLFVLNSSTAQIPLRTIEVLGAKKYEFQIAKTKDFRKPQFVLSSPSSTTKLNQNLESGSWYVRARALTDKSFSDWSKPVDFRVERP